MSCCGSSKKSGNQLSFISDAMPVVKKMLNVKKSQDNEPDNIKVKRTGFFDFEYMQNHELSDNVISRSGMREGVDFVYLSKSEGLGCTLYSCRGNPKIKYVILYCIDDGDAYSKFMFAKSKDMFKVLLHIKKQEKSNNKKFTQPILKEGLLEGVVDNSIGILKNKALLQDYDANIKKGIVLHGPPGNGKTLTCKYIRHLCNMHNYSYKIIDSATIIKTHSNGNEISTLFLNFDVIFFDDIDINLFDRRSQHATIAGSLLTALDGMSRSACQIRIFSTNEMLCNFDKAFLRPGRIDEVFEFSMPSNSLRLKVLEKWPNEIFNQDKIKMQKFSKRMVDFSFSDIEGVKSVCIVDWINGHGWNIERSFEKFISMKEDSKNPDLKKFSGFTAEPINLSEVASA